MGLDAVVVIIDHDAEGFLDAALNSFAEPVDPLEPRAGAADVVTREVRLARRSARWPSDHAASGERDDAGLRVLGLDHGLPRLPDLEFAIDEKKRSDKAAAAIAAALLALSQARQAR